MPLVPIPVLSKIPVLGDILFNHQPTVYMTVIIVVAVWFFLFKTTWGLNIRSVGENPAAAETSGINVEKTRYAATLIGAALVGLGGAVLTVVQLKLFREGITAGRGWIAVALVIFARWRPKLALVGTLLFGLADAAQVAFRMNFCLCCLIFSRFWFSTCAPISRMHQRRWVDCTIAAPRCLRA
jgi:simple sugar transport system permease protein